MKNKFPLNIILQLLVVFVIYVAVNYCALFANDWYEKNTDYYKIITTKNSVAKLEIDKLLIANPELEGKSSDHLNLMYNGEKYPFYYSNGNIIKKGDYIYFLGKQASGDTTYYDNYTNETAFYLYYSETETNPKLKDFPIVDNTENEIKSVTINYHLEKDYYYYLGYDATDYNTSKAEGWYWKIIQDYPGNSTVPIFISNARLLQNILFFPDKNSNEEIEFTVKFATILASETNQNVKRKIFTLINSDTVNKILFDTLADKFIATTKVNPQKLLPGVNSLQILNLTNDKTESKIAVDYFKFKGNSKPFAVNSKAEFTVQNVVKNSIINIDGFSDSIIVFYDTLSQSIVQKKGTPITSININTKAGKISGNDYTPSFATIKLNDSLFANEKNGLHIAILRTENSKVEFNFFDTYNDKLDKLLKNIPANSVVAIAYNDTNIVPNSLKTFLLQNGCTLINNFVPNTAYSCALKVGSEKYESYSETDYSNIDTNLNDAERRFFTVNLNVLGNDNLPKNYHFNICDLKEMENVSIEKTHKTDYKNPENSAEMIIIYHKNFTEKAQEYAEYRIKQGYKIFTADVDEIYKEFGFGKKSPQTIKNFLQYAYQNWKAPAPKYVLLIGDASLDPRLCNPRSKNIDFIPTYGNPASDYWYGAFNENNPTHKSELMIGRIPAMTNEQISNYLEKVKTYEASPAALWQKRFVFINGGDTENEKKTIRDNATIFAKIASSLPLCTDTTLINKDFDDHATSSQKKKNEIIDAINNGTMFTIYNGHGSPLFFDLEGWNVENLNNKGKYGIFATLSCNTGAFAEPDVSCRSEDYLLHKDKGFVLTLGSTTVATMSSNHELMNNILQEILPPLNMRCLADLLEKAKQKANYNTTSKYPRVMQYCFLILGDPLVKLKLDTLPDLYISENEIMIKSSTGENVVKENDDSVNVTVPINNAGLYCDKNFKIKLIHNHKDKKNIYFAELPYLCKTETVSFSIPIKEQVGQHSIEIIVDCDNGINENNKSNNIASSLFYVYNTGLLAVEPQPYWNMKTNGMLFRFINPLSKTSKFNYYCSIYKINNGDTSLVKSAEDNEIKEYENYIDWTPDFVIENSNSDNSNYFVTVHQKDMNTNLISGKLIVPFNVYHLLKDEEAVWSVRSKDEMNVFKLQNMNVTESKNNLYKVSLSQDSLDGKAVSALIGPSTKWNKINIGGNFEAPNATSRIIISGYKNSTGTAEKLIDIEPNSEINISSINANEYPFITVTFASMRTDETSEHYLSDLSVVFTPSAEIAVKSQTDFANKNSVLRGDTVKLNLFAENISLRAKSQVVKINIDVKGDNSGTSSIYNFGLAEIPSNRDVKLQYNIETDFFEKASTVSFTVDTEKVGKELYYFNNAIVRSLDICEDTVKPRLEISFDNDLVFNKDNISEQPNIEVKLMDNSALPITIAKPIKIKLNTVLLDEKNTQFYEEEITKEKGHGVKAKLKIIPEKIVDKENFFTFIGTDATGNSDTVSYYLYITINNFIEKLTNYPNPVLSDDGKINFNFYLVTRLFDLESEIEIYNSLGMKVKTIKTPVKMRNNYIVWDLKDESGYLINPGTYYYKLTINSELWTDPQWGKFIFIK